MHLIYNFQLILEQDFNLSFQNRGFQYNDGMFDTLIWQNGKVRFLADHLERTKKALQVLDLHADSQLFNYDFITDQINVLIQKNNLAKEIVRIKINIWRKVGGLFTPETDAAEILISAASQHTISKNINQADFCTTVFNHYTAFSFFKGPYAGQYVQASIAKKKAGLDEMILLDDKGHISEALVANIFWIKNNELFTPSLASGCIAGIMRLNIVRACQMLTIPVWEGLFPKTDLVQADAVFTSNVTSLRPIQTIGDQSYLLNHGLIAQLENLVLAQGAIA